MMFRKSQSPAPAAASPRTAANESRDLVPSGFHESSRELAVGLEVTDGTVSALPEDLKSALSRLRQLGGLAKD